MAMTHIPLSSLPLHVVSRIEDASPEDLFAIFNADAAFEDGDGFAVEDLDPDIVAELEALEI